MKRLERPSLADVTRAEFAHTTTYLNTATCGVLPRRAVAAVRDLAEAAGAGRPEGFGSWEAVASAREVFGRLTGVPAGRVAVASAVSTLVGLISASLPAGAEVLLPEGEFASVINPFALRPDLKTRYAPLEGLADAVRPGTALVALSAVQSADGRIADLDAVRRASTAHGARMLVDATQAVGWLPFEAGRYDYTVTGGYKWLLGMRGVAYLTVTEEAQESLLPLHAGWVAAESIWEATYGPMRALAADARRFDECPAFVAFHAAAASLALLESVGVAAVHAHNTALAARYRDGLAALGHVPVAAGGSAIVSVPGLGGRQAALGAAGVFTADRAGALRAAFHFYNTVDDVDRLLGGLAA
ncbi:aminotransferase class V-fold PLP-dependent enzyme [Streptomyces sp. NPDC093225]|uniref:aminotransferase class V-fold PLP-dependent enzyme n=1 Tax=Streptomyces sp. NPDC093225 TaxID=3366034 RepID=UPI003828120F